LLSIGSSGSKSPVNNGRAAKPAYGGSPSSLALYRQHGIA
jgi:hypothetical protein